MQDPPDKPTPTAATGQRARTVPRGTHRTRLPEGWIKIHRKALDSWIFDCERWFVWSYLLLSANWEQTVKPTRAGPVKVDRGQILTSERELSKRLKIGRKVVRTTLGLLERDGAISRHPAQGSVGFPAQGGTLITICKYEVYQEVALGHRPEPGPRPAHQGDVSLILTPERREEKRETPERAKSNINANTEPRADPAFSLSPGIDDQIRKEREEAASRDEVFQAIRQMRDRPKGNE